LFYLIKTNRKTKEDVRILIDSGATKNYCRPNIFSTKKLKSLKPIQVESLHGTSKIRTYYKIKIFGHELNFFELKELKHCDLILGLEGLKILNAQIDFKTNKITYCKKLCKTEKINFTVNPKIELNQKNKFHAIINNCIADTSLPFNINVEAAIRTEKKDPVWSKSYPYPFHLTDFVNKEIRRLEKKME
jgi:predicted aspartyl protease